MSTQKKPSSLRIIAGKWRGRKISFMQSEGLRPTPDRVRETVFNWLQGEIVGARCLDLFAGSGALGFEARSRGASQVVMIDQDMQTAANLEQTINHLQADHCFILSGDYKQYKNDPLLKEAFDIIFLDPPFANDLLVSAFKWVVAENLIAPGGWIYWESDHQLDDATFSLQGWDNYRSAKAGRVYYGLLQKL